MGVSSGELGVVGERASAGVTGGAYHEHSLYKIEFNLRDYFLVYISYL